MDATMKKDQQTEWNLARGSKPTPPIEIGDSNDGSTKIQISQEPEFDFGFHEEEEVQKQGQLDDFDMFFKDDESNGSQHSTSKPKQKKKKKVVVSRKEFLDLKNMIDKIITVVSSQEPP